VWVDIMGVKLCAVGRREPAVNASVIHSQSGRW
jgi:hypothetical protein